METIKFREIGQICSKKGSFDATPVLEGLECLSQDDHLLENENDEIIPPFTCAFCRAPGHEDVLATADEEGLIQLYDTNRSGPGAFIKEWHCTSNAVFDIAWSADGKTLASASGDQTIALWDVSSGAEVATLRGHTSSVKSVNFQYQSNDILITGSRDGNIMIWDTRVSTVGKFKKPVNIIRNAHYCKPSTGTTPRPRKRAKLGPPLEAQQSVTSVVSQDGYRLISSGAIDGTVKVWDLRRTYVSPKADPSPCHTFPYPGTSIKVIGYSHLSFDSSRTRLFASCTDDVIYQFDCSTYASRPASLYRGHQNSTFFVKTAISVDDLFLISGSSDHNAYIWKIDCPQFSPVLLKGHADEVTSVDWSPKDIGKVVTLSDDGRTSIWRLKTTGCPSDPAELIGLAEQTRREIGTSISCDDIPATSRVMSPGRTRTVTSHVTSQTPKLKNASLKKWFSPNVGSKLMMNYKGKSPRKIPLGTSPRKLIVSPMKGVKRKFTLEHDTPSSGECSKRQRTTATPGGRAQTGAIGASPFGANRGRSPVAKTSPRKVFAEVNSEPDVIACTDLVSIRSRLFPDSDCARVVNSPTSNLPNLVHDEIQAISKQTKLREISKRTVPSNTEAPHNSEGGIEWLTKLSGKTTPEITKKTDLKKSRKQSSSDPATPGAPTPKLKTLLSYFNKH